MYSGQGLVTANSRSAAGSSLKYAAELNIAVVSAVSEFVCKKHNNRSLSITFDNIQNNYSPLRSSFEGKNLLLQRFGIVAFVVITA